MASHAENRGMATHIPQGAEQDKEESGVTPKGSPGTFGAPRDTSAASAQFRNAGMGVCAPERRLDPQTLHVRRGGNFEVCHKSLRGKAARNLGGGGAKGGSPAIGRAWAGADALQVLGEISGVRENMFRGANARSYCAAGQLESRCEVSLVLRRGRRCGAPGSFPPLLGRAPLSSSARPMHGGAHNAAGASGHAEDSRNTRSDEGSAAASDTPRGAFASLLEAHRVVREGNSAYAQRLREGATRFERGIGAPPGRDEPRLLSEGDSQVSTFLATMYSAAYQGRWAQW